MTADIEELHRNACLKKQLMYEDPSTGLFVQTEYHLLLQANCCGNGCRHCPYGHANVTSSAKRINKLQAPVIMRAPVPDEPSIFQEDMVDCRSNKNKDKNKILVVFWSGGKDSFLALNEVSTTIKSLSDCTIILLTTMDPDTNSIPIQNISVPEITAQAKAMNLPICLVPLSSNADYTTTIKNALNGLPKLIKCPQAKIEGLVFGDLHLQDIRSWREQTFAEYTLYFPLFGRDQKTDLIPKLFELCRKHQATIAFTCGDLHESGRKQGSKSVEYNLETINKLSEGTDLMGENGEFHTQVVFDEL
ncbi:hypothetical protein HDV05_005243 [Chytridiales sp. JEL 0842]|nr:hypothetical protein HDV05_005243 [Chytridiales sp. JEL 0842]